MCGIAATWGHSDLPAVRKMTNQLRHRGPDADGFLQTPHGVLGHRRLAIVDPDGGNQPIHGADGTTCILANGEIYNHQAVRRRLAPSRSYSTKSDSESALALYEQVGDSCASQLDGMFAFMIVGGPDLYVARDPLGIKPLYYCLLDDGWGFASEIKVLAEIAGDVREVPPGTWARFDGKNRGHVPFHPYHDLGQRDSNHAASPSECAENLRQALESAVIKRLMSDVPVGAFLSGGLDSSIVAALMREHVDVLHTFSVGTEGSTDLEAARVVARHLGTVHHEYILTAREVREQLPQILFQLESFDQDLVRSAIPCYFVSRLAADHVKVVSIGEGADELFAGYAYYKGYAQDCDQLGAELNRSLASMHNINLQRVDRMTMAHSIEGRVPFLDLQVIETASSIPARMKLRREGEQTYEKWILRRAVDDLLPDDIVWRKKEQFDEGSGTTNLIHDLLGHFLPRARARRYRARRPDARLRSHEETVYHHLLASQLTDPEPVLHNVARWALCPHNRSSTCD